MVGLGPRVILWKTLEFRFCSHSAIGKRVELVSEISLFRDAMYHNAPVYGCFCGVVAKPSTCC